jgi:DNA-damage-inducible protein J
MQHKEVIMDTVTTSIRVDAQLKREADRLFADLGMNFSTAVNTFLRQAVREQGLPFRPTRDVPNAETLAAMREADRIASDPDARGFASVDELFADLDA